jgi:hypothetical protein
MSNKDVIASPVRTGLAMTLGNFLLFAFAFRLLPILTHL